MAGSSEGTRVGSRVPAIPEIALGACLVGLALFTAIVAEADKVVGEREPAIRCGRGNCSTGSGRGVPLDGFLTRTAFDPETQQ